MDLQGNQLGGKIPASWAALPALISVSVANNPGLCTANPGASQVGANAQLYYGPCDPPSPALPGINPNYPAVPVVSCGLGGCGGLEGAPVLLALDSWPVLAWEGGRAPAWRRRGARR